MTEPEQPEQPDTPDPAFAALENLDKVIAFAAGVKQQCVDRGFSPESGEAVAVEVLTGMLRNALETVRPPRSYGFLDQLRRAAR